MPTLRSSLNTSDSEYTSRYKGFQKLITELQEYRNQVHQSCTQDPNGTLASRKKLPVAERIQALIDPRSAFLEIGSFAGLGMYEGTKPGAGIVTGIGKVAGRVCMIVANNPTQKGGTYFPMTVKKHLRAQEIALQNSLPCIYLVDSGGAFLPLQAEVFPDREHFGRIFYNQAVLSRNGVPQIAAVLGSCTAGGAYVPAMCDQTIMVRGNATIFLGGPPLVKAATGETVTAEELGGAEIHCNKSGVADLLAEDEAHALSLTREMISNLGNNALPQRYQPEQVSEEPLFDADELLGIVGPDIMKVFSVREVLARLVDGSRFDEFKPSFAETVKCGFAHVHGYLVGIVANDGILFGDSALKATHFIELCAQRLIPLVFLQNIVGFMVGKEAEHSGIAKHGAKMVNAVATARVPKISLFIGGSFGAGNYAMCGRAYDPNFLFTWPNSRISVMGGAQAANVLAEVRYSGEKKKDVSDSEVQKFKQEIVNQYEQEGSPYFASARLWDDGVIDPRETRDVLALALASCNVNPHTPNSFGVFRM